MVNQQLRQNACRRTALLRAGFDAFCGRTDVAAEALCALASFRPGVLLRDATIRFTAYAVRKTVGWDRSFMVDCTARDAMAASEGGDSKQFYKSLKRLTTFKPKPLPFFVREDGSAVADSAEQAALIQGHFAALMRGTIAKRDEPLVSAGLCSGAPGVPVPTEAQLACIFGA